MDNPDPLENRSSAIKALYRNYAQRVKKAKKYAWWFLFSNIALLFFAIGVVVFAPWLAQRDVRESLAETRELIKSEEKELEEIETDILKWQVTKFSDMTVSDSGKTVIVVGNGGVIRTFDENGEGEYPDSKTKKDLKSVSISSDEETAIAVGQNGTITISTDRGKGWTVSERITKKDFNDVASWKEGDHLYAIAVGKNGTILISEDGGRSWKESIKWKESIGGMTNDIKAITFVGGTAVAVGENGTILVSEDHGKKWTAQSVKGLNADQTKNIHFSAVTSSSDGRTIIAVGNNGTVWSSEDGVENWNVKSVKGLNADQTKNIHFSAVTFSGDDSTVIAVGNNGTICGSTDRGRTWKAYDSKDKDDLLAIALSDDGKRGVAVGKDGTVLVTTNGGRTWFEHETRTPSELTDVVLDDNFAIFIGENSTILRSKLEEGHTLRNMKIKTISDRHYAKNKLEQLKTKKEKVVKSLDDLKERERKIIAGPSDPKSGGFPTTLLQTNLLRVGLLTVLILMSQHVIKLARYNFRLMTFYRARQDVLLMTKAEALPWSMLSPEDLEQAANALSPDHVDPELSSKTPMDTFIQSVPRRIKQTPSQ